MALKSPRRCRFCGNQLPSSAHHNVRYCNDSCRKKFARDVNKLAKAGIDGVPGPKNTSQAVTPAVKAARALAFEGMEDEIRDTLRAEVRAQVTQHLKDNILGAVEALTALLPEVLVKLGEDVQHGDWMRSSRAQALILKYAMNFKDVEASDADARTINIFHGVPIPDTALGERMREIVERDEALLDAPKQISAQLIDPDAPEDEVIDLPREAYELFYPECKVCGDVKPPETFALIDDEDPGIGLCRSCEYEKQVRKSFHDSHNSPKDVLPEGPASLIEQDE